VYPEHVKLAGVSASGVLGSALNVAGEFSIRWNQDLLADGVRLTDLSHTNQVSHTTQDGHNFVPDNNRNTTYPRGNVAYMNLSAIYVLGRTPVFGHSLWGMADFVTELGYNHLMKISDPGYQFEAETGLPRNNRDPNRTNDALAIGGQFTASYFQALPHTDISPTLGFNYAPKGRSASDAAFGAGCDRCGFLNPSVTFTYLNVWIAKVSYTHYWGKDQNVTTLVYPLSVTPAIQGTNTGADNGDNLSRGLDNVSLVLQRTF
jgi:hypothetical protein